jgi:glycerol dehydrogenase-like iron-containing ADH family enzyme
MTDNVVTQALDAQYIRTANLLAGSQTRLAYAQSQMMTEQALIEKYTADIGLLTDAIVKEGGDMPTVGSSQPNMGEPG